MSAPEGRRVTSVVGLGAGGDGSSESGARGQRPSARQISLAEGERAQFRCVAPAGYPVWPLIWKLNGQATIIGGFFSGYPLPLAASLTVHSVARSGERERDVLVCSLSVQYRVLNCNFSICRSGLERREAAFVNHLLCGKSRRQRRQPELRGL